VDSVTAEIEDAKGEAAANAAELLADGESILTHDYSTTALEAIEHAAGGGAYLDVYVTEARPRFLGRKTARRLGAMDRVEATLIVDSAAGHYMEACDRVLTGMTCIVEKTLYNRVGTYPIAAAASDADVPMTVTGSSAKVIDTGFVFENEYREGSEVLREPTEGFAIGNPTYDATPLSLVDTVVTDEGELDASGDD
jgi:translation initiation factor eIF-2B subunit delta